MSEELIYYVKEEVTRNIVATILHELMFVEDYEEFCIVWKLIYERYKLGANGFWYLIPPNEFKTLDIDEQNALSDSFYY